MCIKLINVQNFCDLVQGEHFSNSGLNGRGIRECAFSTENWPYLGNGERYTAKVTINF